MKKTWSAAKQNVQKGKLSSASIVTSVFQENVGLVHMKGLTWTKNLLHAAAVARGSLPREVWTSMQKLTQERSPSSVGIVTSVLVTKDIWTSMKEFIQERNPLSAANVAGVSHGQEFYDSIKELIQGRSCRSKLTGRCNQKYPPK